MSKQIKQRVSLEEPGAGFPEMVFSAPVSPWVQKGQQPTTGFSAGKLRVGHSSPEKSHLGWGKRAHSYAENTSATLHKEGSDPAFP